jgi:ABC-type bacteriocin/lantibiotic exporter with double-glycine peptidase domain
MAFFSRSTQPAPTEFEPMPGEALISLNNLEKSYAHGTSRTWVLRRVTLDIKDGEFVSIMGPSGAGKSTLLHIIGMHDSAWTGDFYFGGQPVHPLTVLRPRLTVVMVLVPLPLMLTVPIASPEVVAVFTALRPT